MTASNDADPGARGNEDPLLGSAGRRPLVTPKEQLAALGGGWEAKESGLQRRQDDKTGWDSPLQCHVQGSGMWQRLADACSKQVSVPGWERRAYVDANFKRGDR